MIHTIETFAYKGPSSGHKSYLRDRLLLNTPNVISVDIETKSLKDRSIIGIGFGLSPTEAIYVPAHSPDFDFALLPLCDPTITKVFHNCLYDLPELRKLSPHIDTTNIMDTQLMCIMEGLPQELASLSSLLGKDIKRISDILPKRATMDQLPDEVVADKCLDDCMSTMLAYEKLWPDMNQDYLLREMRLIPVLMRMSERGLAIDQERRQQLETKLSAEVEFYRDAAEAEGFNPASPQQVAHMLMMRGNRIKTFRKGKVITTSVDEEVLRKLSDPMAALVLNFRKASKLLSTYIIPYKNQDRAYTHFHINASTGRISSTKRNMQNIPPGVGDEANPGPRTMFTPDKGTWLDYDFSQQELRTLAYMSQDKKMSEIFETGRDVHQEVADFIFGHGGRASHAQRKVTKNINFAAIYGASDETINETAGINNIKLAREIGQLWRTMFPRAAVWMLESQEFGLNNGYVTSIQGRKLWMPTNEQEYEIRRKAVNYRIQASAAEITKDALLKTAAAGYDVTLQVHDEILIDGDAEDEAIRSLGVEALGPFVCPIDIKRYSRWQ